MRILSTISKSFCYAIPPVGLNLWSDILFFFFGGARRHIVIVRACSQAQRTWKQTLYYAIYVHYKKWRKLNKFPFAYYQFIAICFSFSDIDEFNTDFKSCHNKALCHNTQGSYTCSCKPGYEGDGYNCTGKNSLICLFFCFFFNPFKTVRLGWEVTDVMFWNQCKKGNVF